LALIALDDQDADETMADLARLIAMRMEEEGPGVGKGEIVSETRMPSSRLARTRILQVKSGMLDFSRHRRFI